MAYIATTTSQVAITEKWELFAEALRQVAAGAWPEEVMDEGIGYLIHKNIKLDLMACKGLTYEAPEYFITTGISFRFK